MVSKPWFRRMSPLSLMRAQLRYCGFHPRSSRSSSEKGRMRLWKYLFVDRRRALASYGSLAMISRRISFRRLINVGRALTESKIGILRIKNEVDGSHLVFMIMTKVCGWKAIWKPSLTVANREYEEKIKSLTIPNYKPISNSTVPYLFPSAAMSFNLYSKFLVF